MAKFLTQLSADIKDAMRSKDRDRLTVLRMIVSDIKAEQDKTGQDDLDEAAELAILLRAVKTRKESVQMARDAGARKVYFASASPPVRYPNIYGIDMPATRELVASGRTEKEIEKELGADWLIYQELEDLIEACHEGNERIRRFDTSCFSGEYVTGVQKGYLETLQLRRSDQARTQRRVEKTLQLTG